MMNNSKFYLLASLVLMLGLGLWLTGCESDTVAPHDETPALTSEDVAYQAATMASAAGTILPQLVEYSGPNKNEYTYTFSAPSDVSGTIYFDFRTGGAEGSPAPYDTADWGRLYTATGEPVTVALGIGGGLDLTFDITAGITRDPDTALVNGGGTFTSGDYGATFTFTDLEIIQNADYPASGTMTFVSGNYTMTVTFDGTSTAVISLNGTPTWTINLDNASIQDIPG